jgi:hypothetical protein
MGISKNKVCLKGTEISGYRRYPKIVTMALKAIPQQEFQKRSQQWQHHQASCIAAQGKYFEGTMKFSRAISRLTARENFIILSRREGNKSHSEGHPSQ